MTTSNLKFINELSKQLIPHLIYFKEDNETQAM